MIAELILVCWLICCIYVPLLWALTASPPSEERRVVNALVRVQARELVRAWRRHDVTYDRERVAKIDASLPRAVAYEDEELLS